jgi:hypothetical protein
MRPFASANSPEKKHHRQSVPNRKLRNLKTLEIEQGIRGREDRTDSLFSRGRESRLNVLRSACLQFHQSHPDRARRHFGIPHLGLGLGIREIDQRADRRRGRDHLVQQLQAFHH